MLRRCRLLAFSALRLFLALSLVVPSAFANPSGGTVAAGQAIIGSAGGTLTVRQLTNTAIINWRDFSIAAGETTKFVQPSSLSAALNRVTGGNPSAIYGTLAANGKVYLINPNGITVGPTGVIDTQSFIASTLDVADADFLAGGNLKFTGSSLASVSNAGRIDAVGGDVLLIAHSVQNTGQISAPGGAAALAAGSEVLYQPSADQPVFVQAGNGVAPVGVDQQGQIQAAEAELTAAGGNVYGLAINNAGVVRADGVAHIGGHVYLTAPGGSVVNSGALKATDGDVGGTVTVAGDSIDLKPGSTIDVSGPGGGGTALIGGGARGADASVPDANTATVEAGATIDADATASGNGGNVVVWSNQSTDFYGLITSHGGPLAGNGGSVEVSGQQLAFAGIVDTTAPKGKTGTLLLDPENLIIESNGGVCVDPTCPAANAGQYSAGGTPGATSILDNGVLDNMLNTSNVLVETTNNNGAAGEVGNGDLTVASQVSWTAHNALDLQAYGNIYVNAPISGGGAVYMAAGGNSPSLGKINIGANVTSGSGDQTYVSPVVITAATTPDLQANGYDSTTGIGGQVIFQDTVNGSGSLSIASSSISPFGVAAVQFQGAVGATTPLGGMSISSGSGIIEFKNGGVASAGDQFYSGHVLVDNADAAFSATGAGSVMAFWTTLDAASRAVSLSAPGGVTLGAAGTDPVTGATYLNQLTATSAGGINLNGATYALGPDPSTAGTASSFTGPVSLGGDTAITSHGSLAFSSTITGNSHSLTTNSTTQTTFGGSVTGLTSFDATAEAAPDFLNQSQINLGGSIGAAGDVNFHSPVVLTGDSTLSAGGALDFAYPLSGTHNLTTVSGNGTTFNTLGTLASLSATDTSASGINLDQYAITTTGAQSYAGIVHCAICSTNLTASTWDAGGAFAFNGTFDNYGLNVSASSVQLAGNVTTATDQSYTGPIALTGDTTLKATGGALTFNNAINGAYNLTTQSSGVTTFTGGAGGSTPLNSLTTTASAFALDGGSYVAQNDLAFNAPVTLGGAVGAQSLGGSVTFGGAVNGAFDLTTQANGSATFGGALGGSTPLNSFSATAGSGIFLNGGGVSTVNDQTFNGATKIGADTTLDSSAGAIAFNGSIDSQGGNNALTSTSAGATSFSGNIGASGEPSTLSMTAPSIAIGGDVFTTDAQTFTGNVSLSANGTLNPGPSNTLLTSGPITINGTLDGVSNFYPNAFGKPMTITGDVGDSQPLLSFNPGVSALTLGGDVKTWQTQTYTMPLTLSGNGSLHGAGSNTFTSNLGDVDFFDTISGSPFLYAVAKGAVGFTSTSLGSFGTPWGGLNLTGTAITIPGDVVTTGNQTYNGPVTLGGLGSQNTGPSNSFVAMSGAIAFNGTLDGSSNLFATWVQNGLAFNGNVGSGTPLVSINAVGSGPGITIAGDVTTTGNPVEGGQTYFGNVTLLGNGTANGPGSNTLDGGTGSMLFSGTVNGASNLYVHNDSGGGIQFGGSLGGGTPLASLTATADSGKIFLRNVATAGNQTYNGAVSLSGFAPTALSSTRGAIAFNGPLDGGSDLTTTALNGTSFNGAVGGATPLASISATDPTGIVLSGDVATTGAQAYHGPVSLAGQGTLGGAGSNTLDAGGLLTFDSTVDPAGAGQNAILSSGGGISFGGDAGGVSPFKTFVAGSDASIALNGHSIAAGGDWDDSIGALPSRSQVLVVAANITFNNPLDSVNPLDLTLDAGGGAGKAAFLRDVGSAHPLHSLTVTGESDVYGNVTTNGGGQTYGGLVDLRSSAIAFADTGGGAIAFDSDLASGIGSALTLQTGGSTILNGATGALTSGMAPLGSLTLSGSGTADIRGDVNANTQTYDGPVVVNAGGPSAVSVHFNGASTFNSTLDDGPNGDNVAFNGLGGNVTFNDAVNPQDFASFGVDAGGGNVAFNGASPLTFKGTTTIQTSGAGSVTFSGTVDDFDGAGTLNVTSGSGGIGFGDAVGFNQPFANLNLTANGVGSAIVFNDQGNGSLYLGGNAAIATNSGTAIFNGTVDDTAGGSSLTFNNTSVIFKAAVGGNSPLGSLSVDNGAAAEIDGGLVATSGGGQSYTGPVVLGNAGGTTTLSDSGGGAIAFGNFVDGISAGLPAPPPQALTVQTDGAASFASPVGSATPLQSFAVQGFSSASAGSTSFGGGTIVTSGGGQAYSNPLTLGNDMIASDTGGGAIAFASTVDGAFNLSTQTSGSTTFDGLVGSNSPLASLSVSGPSALDMGGNPANSVATTGDQTFTGPVTLGASGAQLSAGGNVTFGGAVDGTVSAGQGLNVLATGNVFFDGAVGAGVPLANLYSTGASTHLNGGSVSVDDSGGTQQYSGPVILGSNETLTAGGCALCGIFFNSTVDGPYGLTVAPGNGVLFSQTDFSGQVGQNSPLASLTTTGGSTLVGSVATRGAQTYNGAAFGISPTLTSTAGPITLANGGGALIGDLTIDAGTGDVAWGGPLSGSNVLIQGAKLTMNGDVGSSGATGVTLVASSAFDNPASHAISPTGGGRFLIYSVLPGFDDFGGLTGSSQFGVLYPALPSFAGNGFLFHESAPDFPDGYSTLEQQQSFYANNFLESSSNGPGAGRHGLPPIVCGANDCR